MWYRFTRGDAYALPELSAFGLSARELCKKIRNAKPKKHKSKPEEAIVKPEAAVRVSKTKTFRSARAKAFVVSQIANKMFSFEKHESRSKCTLSL